MADIPVPQKDFRQLLRESVNATTAELGRKGFEGIDELARRGHKRLADAGVTVSPELTERVVFSLKELIARGIGGKK